tara:strand:+ start:216 stop:428 length:213 start_codon:yes stop_codon:yes gene_type:complete
MGKMSWIAYLVDCNRRKDLIEYLEESGFTHPVESADDMLRTKNSLIDDGIWKGDSVRYDESDVGESYGGE